MARRIEVFKRRLRAHIVLSAPSQAAFTVSVVVVVRLFVAFPDAGEAALDVKLRAEINLNLFACRNFWLIDKLLCSVGLTYRLSRLHRLGKGAAQLQIRIRQA